MIKKFSVFFSPQIRKLCDSDPEFMASPGFRAIIGLPALLLGILDFRNSLRIAQKGEEEGRRLYGAAWEMLSTSHSSHDNLLKTLQCAYRMEMSVVQRYAVPPSGRWYLHAEINLYKKEDTKPLMAISPIIREEDGCIGAFQYSCVPCEFQ